MDLLRDLLRTGYPDREVRVVDRDGRRVSGFPAAAFTPAAGSKFTSLPRGDLAAAIYGALDTTPRRSSATRSLTSNRGRTMRG
jgi:hypothetical protein